MINGKTWENSKTSIIHYILLSNTRKVSPTLFVANWITILTTHAIIFYIIQCNDTLNLIAIDKLLIVLVFCRRAETSVEKFIARFSSLLPI